jgi:hypothetical protein
VSPVKYEKGFYITEDDILHSYRRENLKSYVKPNVYIFTLHGRRTNVDGLKRQLSGGRDL